MRKDKNPYRGSIKKYLNGRTAGEMGKKKTGESQEKREGGHV